MTLGSTVFDNDGRSVSVTLSYPTTTGTPVLYVEGFLGIGNMGGLSGASGETRALTIDHRAYTFEVPATLTVNKGDTVYIDTTAVTGTHEPPIAAYGTASGANKLALFKAIEAKDTNNNVTGILLPLGVQ